MSIIKRGRCSSRVVVSEAVYNCPDCGHVEMTSDADSDEKKCPHCNISMVLMSSTSHIEEENEEIDDKEEKNEE